MKRISIFLLAALALAGCKSGPNTRFSEATIGQGFAATNRAGVVISGGQQVNTLLGGDGAFSEWKDVATAAAASGNEFSLMVIGHGAARQPDVKRESTSAKKAQDAFVGGLAKAAGGDKAGAAEAIGEAMLYAAAYASESANPPQADETGLVAAHAAIGPGANIAGIGVASELRQTRVEAIKAARSTYQTVTRYEPQDITTTNGLATVNAALPYLADAYKAKLAADADKSAPQVGTPVATKPGDPEGGQPDVGDSPTSGSGGADLSDRPAYDTLTKKNFLYKHNPERLDSAVLVPLDRPKPVSIYIPGQTLAEKIYESESEKRWMMRMKGAKPNTPSAAVITYADGNSETFAIASLAGRTDKPAGPYKPATKPEAPKVEEPSDAGDAAAPGE